MGGGVAEFSIVVALITKILTAFCSIIIFGESGPLMREYYGVIMGDFK